MKTELRINEIMLEKNVSRNDAEDLFEDEVCERYGTNNLDLAKAMFNAD